MQSPIARHITGSNTDYPCYGTYDCTRGKCGVCNETNYLSPYFDRATMAEQYLHDGLMTQICRIVHRAGGMGPLMAHKRYRMRYVQVSYSHGAVKHASTDPPSIARWCKQLGSLLWCQYHQQLAQLFMSSIPLYEPVQLLAGKLLLGGTCRPLQLKRDAWWAHILRTSSTS